MDFIDFMFMEEIEEDYKRKNSDDGGCYIATSVYGTYDSSELWTLRRFRDEIISKNILGKSFIKLYYIISPKLVKYFGENIWFKKLFKFILDKFVSKLQEKGIESTFYIDIVIILFIYFSLYMFLFMFD